jgi:aspartyl-tRNA(Asn)/glutamyl-tRNA(Gln) amidotransferase subunit C
MADPTTTVTTDRIDVAYVAHLARLQLTPEETGQFQSQLEQIVAYVRKLNEVDLSAVEPTAHAVALRNVFRQDEVVPGLDHEKALGNAPAQANEQFAVPRIIEE